MPLGLGLSLNLGGAGLFARLGTNIKTFNDPGRLVDTGLFRVTRNPMYLGFFAMLCGVALALGVASAWIGPVLFFMAAQLWYIPFEERRMHETFGGYYIEYQRRVPRWVGPRSFRAR